MKFSKTDLMWTAGLFLLLTFCLWLMLFLPFGWEVSALISGGVLAIGVAAMIYVTVKSPED